MNYHNHNHKQDEPELPPKLKRVFKLIKDNDKVPDELQQERWYQRFIKELSKWLRPKRP